MSPWPLSNIVSEKFDSFGRGMGSPTAALESGCRRALPQSCAFCVAPCGSALVCAACCSALPRVLSPCPTCALPAPFGSRCGACRVRPPPFAAAYTAFEYAFPLDRLLQSFKYGGQLAHAEFFAGALAERVAQRGPETPWPDAIVALPLAPSRQRQRGFDQAAEIARRVAAITEVPMQGGLRRTRDTPAQASLPWKERAGNVRGAFAADPTLAGKRVAIVDDVMTTGATLASAAHAALRAGARTVEVWAVARTLPPVQSC